MEKDIDEVSKIARLAKSKLEELDKDVSKISRFSSKHFNEKYFSIVLFIMPLNFLIHFFSWCDGNRI